MKLKYTFNLKFKDIKLHDRIKKEIKLINTDYGVYKGRNYSRVYTGNAISYNQLKSLKLLAEELGCELKGDINEVDLIYDIRISKEYEDSDFQLADYINLYTKTEYDSDKYYAEIIGDDLFLDKKGLGNFYYFQMSLEKNDKEILLVKKKFIKFIEENGISGFSFKPIIEKSVTGEKVSKTYFWVQMNKIIDDTGNNYFNLKDKFKQPIPNFLSSQLRAQLQSIDNFHFNSYSLRWYMSGKFYRLLKDNDMLKDVNQNHIIDLGFMHSEASQKFKQDLIEQGSYDFDLEEKYKHA
jgi:hypothetical protein